MNVCINLFMKLSYWSLIRHQKHKYFRIYIVYKESSQPNLPSQSWCYDVTFFLRFEDSLNTLGFSKQDSWKISQERNIFSKLVCSLAWVHTQNFLTVLVNFGRIFLQAALVDCLFKKRTLKELRNYNPKLFLCPPQN